MNRKITAFLAAALACSLCACTSDKPANEPDTAPETTTAPATSQTSTNAETQPSTETTTAPTADKSELSLQGAVDRVRSVMSTDQEAATVYVEDLYSELTEDNVQYPVYTLIVCTGEGDNIHVEERYAVGITENMIWRYIPESDEYQICPQGSPYIEWSVGFKYDAMGIVVRNPDEYCKWVTETVVNLDLSADDPYAETFLLCPMYDDTTVTILKGGIDDETFEFSGEPVETFTLNQGEYAMIRCSVPEILTQFAVDLSHDGTNGIYLVSYDGVGGKNKINCVIPDEMKS